MLLNEKNVVYNSFCLHTLELCSHCLLIFPTMHCFVHPALFPLPMCKKLDSLVCGCEINPSAIGLYKSAQANALFLDAYYRKNRKLDGLLKRTTSLMVKYEVLVHSIKLTINNKHIYCSLVIRQNNVSHLISKLENFSSAKLVFAHNIQ